MTKLRVVHKTEYVYSEVVSSSHHEVHLAPRQEGNQICSATHLEIRPQPAVQHERLDYFGNTIAHFDLHEPHRSLTIVATSEVQRTPPGPPSSLFCPSWEEARDTVREDRAKESFFAYQFAFDSAYVKADPKLLQYAASSFSPGRSLIEAARDLTSRIYHDFTYDSEATTTSTPLLDVLRDRRGVCQDFAHLQIGCLRSLGLPCRYVSGYLHTQPAPGTPKLVGADASHAWVSVYVPAVGWLEFDPTNDMIPVENHITVAYGRDFGDVTPVRGVILGGGRHKLYVSVDVGRELSTRSPRETRTQVTFTVEPSKGEGGGPSKS